MTKDKTTKAQDSKPQYTITDFKELPETSEIEMHITIAQDAFNNAVDNAIKRYGASLKIDGFRQGKAPRNVVIKNIGEPAILEEATQQLVEAVYPQTLQDKELIIIDSPLITITEMPKGLSADNTEVSFTLRAAVPPVFKLPDYKKIAKNIFSKEIKIKVTDKEVDETILTMRRQRALLERIDSGMEPQLAQQEADKLKESDLPELDEEFIKTLGDYKTLDELRKAIKDAITAEKRTQELNKRRSQFAEKIVEKARISLPPALVSYELDRLRAEFTEHLMQAGTTLDAYLQNTGKTDTQFNEELKPQAERNAKLQLLLNKIAEEEKLEPEQSQVEMEVAHLLQHHKDADPRSVHAYVTLQLRNKLVFDFLEKQS